jgi:DeoR/GlpR family transcriptional regulator of sugar metabolism
LLLHFTTQELQKKAKKLEVTSKTAERYITDLCKSNMLVRESHGNYYNPSKEIVEENEGIKGV